MSGPPTASLICCGIKIHCQFRRDKRLRQYQFLGEVERCKKFQCITAPPLGVPKWFGGASWQGCQRHEPLFFHEALCLEWRGRERLPCKGKTRGIAKQKKISREIKSLSTLPAALSKRVQHAEKKWARIFAQEDKRPIIRSSITYATSARTDATAAAAACANSVKLWSVQKTDVINGPQYLARSFVVAGRAQKPFVIQWIVNSCANANLSTYWKGGAKAKFVIKPKKSKKGNKREWEEEAVDRLGRKPVSTRDIFLRICCDDDDEQRETGKTRTKARVGAKVNSER